MTEKEKNIFLEKIRFIYGQGASILIGVMIAVSFLYWVLRDSVTAPYLRQWFFFMMVVVSARLLYFDRVIHRAANTENIRLWKRTYYSILFVTGAGWGFIAWVAFPEIPAHHQALMGLVFIGLFGGMMGRYSVIPPMVIIYCAPFIIPFVIRALMSDDSFANVLGILMATYSVMMTPVMKQVKRAATKSITLNEDLKEEIEQRNRAEKELVLMATTDPLTNISNRRAFYSAANKELHRAERYQKSCCLVLLDIDNFKKVNDEYGHAAGDSTLIKFVQICQAELRESDLIGRIGGDEFAIFLPETDKQSAIEITERLREAIAKSQVKTQSKEFSFTTSIGAICVEEALNVTLESFMNRTDQALYRAKNEGRNRVVFGSV